MSRVGASPEPVDQTNKTCSQQADGFIIPVNDRLTGFLAVCRTLIRLTMRRNQRRLALAVPLSRATLFSGVAHLESLI